MDWYLALGIKIFVGIVLLFQTIIAIGGPVSGCLEEESFNSLVGFIAILAFSVTIPFACWIFNF